MEQKKIWQSFGELNQSEAYNKDVKDEFKDELPFVAEEGKSFLEATAPRRDFLKYLGFSTAAAAAAASCEMPVKKSIPFANRPEEIVPGVSKYYATTYVQDGDVVSVVAKVRDGRPIKLEGNDLSPVTGGGTSARVQASVLDLYDTARLRFPTINGSEVTFDAADKSIADALKDNRSFVVLTSTITSPTTKDAIAQFLAKYPGGRHVTYDAVSYSGMLLANELTYGKKAIPSYQFNNAKAIVSIGADFLGTWLSPVEFAKQYAAGKKINEKNPSMSKHIHFESVASLTGSNADEKYLHRPSETGAIAAALLSAVNGAAITGISNEKLKSGIAKAAKELLENNNIKIVSILKCFPPDNKIKTSDGNFILYVKHHYSEHYKHYEYFRLKSGASATSKDELITKLLLQIEALISSVNNPANQEALKRYTNQVLENLSELYKLLMFKKEKFESLLKIIREHSKDPKDFDAYVQTEAKWI
ncbi:MAG: TAT-variant-translocated molybdopterin oxidoreductase, partial [Bacteroidetes bacterium]|nr:TAT-variant-translocated molybdopterin oxidoreductase [Bacteroidota bacterium]